jgi:hypothetical protein
MFGSISPLVCTVTFEHIIRQLFSWHGESRKDLEYSMYREIWEKIVKDIEGLK